MTKRKRITITGRVQGVGFRPAVYRVARGLGLSGTVRNDTAGVTVELQGGEKAVAAFIERIQGPDLPPLARIESCVAADVEPVEGERAFTITASDGAGPPESEVSPDVAVCGDCLAEMGDAGGFRFRYPFINCTNCGPRYSIVKTIPYDRPGTTMSAFEMCQRCAAQYADVADRRFHAQPVACGACGPRIWLCDGKGDAMATGTDEAIDETRRLLLAGKVVAIKGIGGFHLAVNALEEAAVRRLRERKRRDRKPFAMMAASIEKIREHAEVTEQAGRLLKDPRSPIVLLPKKAGSAISAAVAEGVNTFGFMLCCAPLHHMLFEKDLEVLVMTSGNISDEPLVCENDQALSRLGQVADAFLMNDRDIYRRVDDSIVHFVAGGPVPLRRARGYVPEPVLLEKPSPRGVFAAGADLKNTFCFGWQNRIVCSEHIGDLADGRAFRHYVDSIGHMRQLFDADFKVVACDLHPGYLSRLHALSLPAEELVEVQHHWAHVAGVLAEHDLSGPVIGLACDGTGYGTDGRIWGCECLVASLEGFERFGRLDYYPLAGGDAAAREAIRPLMGLLRKAWGKEFEIDRYAWLLDRIGPDGERQRVILEQIDRGVNTIETSSLGRVFDAVAAAVGLGNRNRFDAQLPMALEAVADGGIEDAYGFELRRDSGGKVRLDLGGMLRRLLEDVRRGRDVAVMSAMFHNCLAKSLAAMAEAAREKTGLGEVAISGGVFCNRYLADRLIELLKRSGFRVLFNRLFPANDGGIAVGQAAIAMRA
jgi:hydrogenase maturation protein HypF